MSWLISAAELAARCAGESRPRILDVRWTLATPDGRADYRAGHIPGAVYVDLDAELSDHAVGGAGRHPLPAPGALQAAARRWGLRDGDPVVVYDDWNALAAARCWWLLRSAGVRDVRVLDGGWSAWLRAGLPSETGEQAPAPGTVTLTPADPGRTVDADAAAALRSAGVRDVRVLDGGWSAWLRAGLPSETGEQAPAPGTVTLTPADPGRTVDADAAAA
ncbi:rhodanese-like domain-containing protein, partial [Mycolicibacterium fallax]|uniref:rhodanese-like domain-containing protein n=1 Tax=Mycolicibacterium fallax TaxID=1793 RepID=UPI0021F2E9CF